jgi:hypothetical protein
MCTCNGHPKWRRTAEVHIGLTPITHEKSARRRFFHVGGEAHFFLATTRTISRHCLA